MLDTRSGGGPRDPLSLPNLVTGDWRRVQCAKPEETASAEKPAQAPVPDSGTPNAPLYRPALTTSEAVNPG